MGFYGNITNTSNTTFSFDRIYPNRLAMDANANNDGIFIGRYVLVEYDNKATISNIFVDTQHPAKIVDGEKYYYAYTTNNFTDINTRIQYKPNNRGENKNINVYFLGEFGQVQKVEGNQLQQEYYTEFYQCVDSIISKNDSTIFYALFKYVTKSTKSDSEYIKNFAIDEAQYKEKKGYDSTVWTKASIKKENGLLVTEYVRIADLNSVVPTFDLETDAPTMKPLVPHFDADSTNVYYKLHTQPQWGLRVAEVESGKISDSKTNWISSTYNPETGQLIPSGDNGEHDAAIYFNKAAFLPQVDTNRKTTDGINKKKEDNQEKNYFTINPTGESGNQYYLHTTLDQNGNLQKVYGKAVDIQEMRINLPAIGNMMSDAWDIIYGPKRDKARTDDNGSLQGRLDSFKAMEDNHIPIKRNDDGTIIGTAINGNNNYQMPNGKNILTTTHFPLTTNDPWINVTIDNSSLQGGYDKDNKIEISQENNNAIRIRHSANSVDPTTTSWDKNNAENYTNNSYNYYEIDTNINGNQDEIKLYTPYVDATGHVVGKNIETVILPYGYKTFTTEGLASLNNEGKEIVEDLYTEIINQEDGNNTSSTNAIQSKSIADNTQDTIAIEPYNKWIQTKLSDDKLVIAHEIHAINTEKSSTDLNDLKDNEIQNKINIPDWDYDKAGHIKKKGEHTYTLPYGYKYIEVANDGNTPAVPVSTTGTQVADNTQDTLKLTTSNKWILLDAKEEDTVKFGHLLKIIAEDKKPTQNLSSEESKTITFEVYDDSFDEAGHHNGRDTKTITMPFGYGKIKGDSGNTEATATFDELNVVSGDDWIDTSASTDQITITHTGPVFTSARNESNKTPNFGDTFTIEDWVFDDKGHKSNLSTHSIKIPKGSLNDLAATSSSVLTGISMIDETGVITQTNNDVGKLALTGYVQGSDKTDIGSGDTINSAFAKLQNQITYEENRINTILTGENDLTDTLDTFIELQSYINEHGQEAADMAKAIENEIARAKEAEEANITAIENEKIRAENIEQGLQGQIEVLQTTIENLQKQINELKNLPQQPDNGGDEV